MAPSLISASISLRVSASSCLSLIRKLIIRFSVHSNPGRHHVYKDPLPKYGHTLRFGTLGCKTYLLGDTIQLTTGTFVVLLSSESSKQKQKSGFRPKLLSSRRLPRSHGYACRRGSRGTRKAAYLSGEHMYGTRISIPKRPRKTTTTGLHVRVGHPDAGDIMAQAGPLPSRAYGVGDILLPILYPPP